MNIPAHYVTTRKAAEIYGCTQPNLTRMMARYGYTPVVERFGGVHGGSLTRYWWDPAAVLMARREARRRKAERGRQNITPYNELPVPVREAIVRTRRLERLRKYYQAKAASRAAA